jgi:chloramphenicol-sensitive protein RarD
MMQFITPTLQFAIAVIFGEELTAAHIICFTLIWLAVILFSVDTWRASRAPARLNP